MRVAQRTEVEWRANTDPTPPSAVALAALARLMRASRDLHGASGQRGSTPQVHASVSSTRATFEWSSTHRPTNYDPATRRRSKNQTTKGATKRRNAKWAKPSATSLHASFLLRLWRAPMLNISRPNSESAPCCLKSHRNFYFHQDSTQPVERLLERARAAVASSRAAKR